MAFDTFSPIGSNDPRDLSDNASNLDQAVNGEGATWSDRFGSVRKTWAGLEQQVADFQAHQGWEAVTLRYVGGAILQRPTQLVEREGELYRVSLQSLLPLTLTGDWAVDAPKLVALGNQPLRSELSGPTGAELVGHGQTTVAARLHQDQSRLDVLYAERGQSAGLLERTFQADLKPAVVDMHFRTLAGIGWNAAEKGGNLGTVTTSPFLISQVDVIVADASIFIANQLITFLASDGQYYPAIIKNVTGNTLRLDRRPPVNVNSGAGVFGFYRDDAHPNLKGAACIVDDAFRQLYAGRIASTEYYGKDGAVWRAIGGASLTSLTGVSYLTPGGTAIGDRAVQVYSASPNGGVESTPVTLQGGDYQTSVFVNPGLRDGSFSNQITVSIIETVSDGTSFVVAQAADIFSYSGIRSIDLSYSARPGSSISVRISSVNSGGYTFYVGAIAHRRLGPALLNLNRGKHVLLGDSWFTSGGEMHSYMIGKLDKAVVISKGIPGNRASQLIERFASDVIPEAPDFVWVMVGTNDYYASVSNQVFEQQIYQLRSMIQALGAQPIFFTPSVGANAPTAGGGDQLPRSRGYALNVRYHEQASSANGAGQALRSATLSVNNVVVPAGGTVLVGVVPGVTRFPAKLRFAAVSQVALNVVVDYPSVVDGAGAVNPTSVAMSSGPANDVQMPRTDTALRFVAVRLHNPTGTALSAAVVADVCWSQSLS